MKAIVGQMTVNVWQVTKDETGRPDFVQQLFEKGTLRWNFRGVLETAGIGYQSFSAIVGFWLIQSSNGSLKFVSDKSFKKDYQLLDE